MSKDYVTCVSAPRDAASFPLISIIMNCYNAADTLREALDSVLAQSYTHWEIIFFDSGSEDDSFVIAQEYAARLTQKNADTPRQSDCFPLIHCIAHGERVVLGEARNLALAQARGEYIAFLDCDDVWLPQKLALQVQGMQDKPYIDVLCTDTEIFMHGSQREGRRLFAQTTPACGAVFSELVQRQWIVLSSVMLRASTLHYWSDKAVLVGHEGFFDPRLQLAADADLLYRLAYLGQCDFIACVLTRRRVHTHSITLQQWEKWPEETRAILAKLQTVFLDFSDAYPDVEEALLQRAFFQEAILFWKQGKGQQARRMLWGAQALRLKYVLFMLVSFFPPSFFSCVARYYSYLPYFLRK